MNTNVFFVENNEPIFHTSRLQTVKCGLELSFHETQIFAYAGNLKFIYIQTFLNRWAIDLIAIRQITSYTLSEMLLSRVLIFNSIFPHFRFLLQKIIYGISRHSLKTFSTLPYSTRKDENLIHHESNWTKT